ncbi:MAG: PRC-barrel domain-containing protein [Gammaproteobacteria bacterium]
MQKSTIARTLMALGFSTCAAAAGWAQQDQTEAQDQQTQQQVGQEPEIIALDTWNYDELYADGWSLEEFVDEAEVRGPGGDEIGDIENVVFDEKNRITAVIAEVGGFWDITDTHVAVPWDEVEVGAGLEYVQIPVTEETVEDYPIYGEYSLFTEDAANNTRVVDDELATGPRLWKATEVLGDYALLADRAGYGYVEDLIIDDQGMVDAIVVSAASRYGPGSYAYPFYGYGYGFEPGDPWYDLRYDDSDVADLETFDEDRLDDDREAAADDDQEQAAAD